MKRSALHRLRVLLILFFAAPFIGFALLFGAMRAVELAGAHAVREQIQLIKNDPDTAAVLLEISADIHTVFSNSVNRNNPNLLLKLRPYLSNELLPDFIRVQPGAIEALLLDGWCDNAVRALMYIASKAGLPAHQLNIVTPTRTGHSILEIAIEQGDYIAIDPF